MADTISGGQGLPCVVAAADVPSNLHLFPEQGSSASCPLPVDIMKGGGIGFQLQGGVITVTSLQDGVNVSFDRPMTYNGDHTHGPASAPFDIGTPSLSLDTTVLDIPITTRSTVASVTQVRVYDDSIQIQLNVQAAISPSASVISNQTAGNVLTISSVGSSGDMINLPLSLRTLIAQVTGTKADIQVAIDGVISHSPATDVKPPADATYVMGDTSYDAGTGILTVPITPLHASPSIPTGGRGAVDYVPQSPVGGAKSNLAAPVGSAKVV